MTELLESRTARLAGELRRRIAAEELADGDLFMTEAQLAKEYGVSRNIAREAVSQLRGLGILEGRKSKGLLVRRPNPVRLLSHSLPSMAQSGPNILPPSCRDTSPEVRWFPRKLNT